MARALVRRRLRRSQRVNPGRTIRVGDRRERSATDLATSPEVIAYGFRLMRGGTPHGKDGWSAISSENTA